jgi:hypothetical protein
MARPPRNARSDRAGLNCCLDTELFSAIIEIIYSMRNALLHGELQPKNRPLLLDQRLQ